LLNQVNQLDGNRTALVQLFETHYERVARYIAVRIGSIDEAEDLASEVFVRALKAIDSYRDTGAPMEAWLFKIARNSVIDHLRDRQRRPRPAELNEGVATMERRDANPDEQMEYTEDVNSLNQAMERLSEAQRQVLALRFGAEMTSEEVAQVVGKKAGAVREMQSAAISKLRQIMQAVPT
jgi:RNA polymerase sigma-70 factor, ECF subfamily